MTGQIYRTWEQRARAWWRLYERGWRRFWIHEPFGGARQLVDGTWRWRWDRHYQLSTYATAQAEEAAWLWDGVIEHLKPLIDAGAEFSLYFGRGSDGGELDFQDRQLWQSHVRPFLEAGFSIGIDASSGIPTSHPVFGHMADLTGRVYVEACPRSEMVHWFEWPITAAEGFVRTRTNATHPIQNNWAAYTKEFIRSLTWGSRAYHTGIPDATRQDVINRGRELLDLGFTIMVHSHWEEIEQLL